MVSRLTATRQERVDREGSPDFQFTPAAIAALGIVRIYIRKQFRDAAKYDPLDNTVVINNSTEQLAIAFNGETVNPKIVPGGTIGQFPNQAVSQFQITNQDAVAATVAGEINVTFSRAALTADELARRYGR